MPIDEIQQQWNEQQRGNRKVKANLARLEEIVATHTTKQAILDALHPWGANSSLKFSNQLNYALFALAVFLLFVSVRYLTHGGLMVLCWSIACCAAVYGWLNFAPKGKVENVIRTLRRAVFADQYQLKPFEMPVIANGMLNSTYAFLKVKQSFPNLRQGNKANEFPYYAATTWQINGYEHPVLVFHYIAIDEETVKDEKGNSYQKQIKTHHFGACIFHVPPLALVISRKKVSYERYPVRWRTSDIQFNQQFYIYGQQEFEIAKNLPPRRVLKLANHLGMMQGQLIFHEELQACCYLSSQNLFKCSKPRQPIDNISQLRGYLRTLQSPHYEALRDNLSAIIASFQDEGLLHAEQL